MLCTSLVLIYLNSDEHRALKHAALSILHLLLEDLVVELNINIGYTDETHHVHIQVGDVGVSIIFPSMQCPVCFIHHWVGNSCCVWRDLDSWQ